jgi:hypothetical protein
LQLRSLKTRSKSPFDKLRMISRSTARGKLFFYIQPLNCPALAPRLDNIVNIFHVKPPLVIRTVLARPKKISGSNSDLLSQAGMHFLPALFPFFNDIADVDLQHLNAGQDVVRDDTGSSCSTKMIAPDGQFASHVPHSMQSSTLIWHLVSPSSTAPLGHPTTQAPHSIHSSVTI